MFIYHKELLTHFRRLTKNIFNIFVVGLKYFQVVTWFLRIRLDEFTGWVVHENQNLVAYFYLTNLQNLQEITKITFTVIPIICGQCQHLFQINSKKYDLNNNKLIKWNKNFPSHSHPNQNNFRYQYKGPDQMSCVYSLSK